MSREMEGWIEGCMDVWLCGCLAVWMDGWISLPFEMTRCVLLQDDKATYAGPLLAFALVSLVPLMFYGMFILVEFFCGEPKKPHKFSALQMAAFYGNVDSVVFLLQNGQDIAFRGKEWDGCGDRFGFCFMCGCLEFEFLYCGKRSKPMTAEMIAKRRGHLEVASILKGYRQGKQLRTSTAGNSRSSNNRFVELTEVKSS